MIYQQLSPGMVSVVIRIIIERKNYETVDIDFCVASLVYVFKSTNTIADLKGEVVGDEVARRIDELVNTDSKP